MNSTKDKIKSNLHEVKGKVKEKVGQVTNTPDLEAEQNTGKAEIKTEKIDPEHEEIACLAYQNWQQRGCPIGTPEEDWFRAEGEIKQHLNESSTAIASTPNPSEAGK